MNHSSALFGGGCLVSESCPTPLQRYGLHRQAPLSVGFPRQEYSSGLPVPHPGSPDPGIELVFPALAAVFSSTEPPGKPSLSLSYPTSGHRGGPQSGNISTTFQLTEVQGLPNPMLWEERVPVAYVLTGLQVMLMHTHCLEFRLSFLDLLLAECQMFLK